MPAALEMVVEQAAVTLRFAGLVADAFGKNAGTGTQRDDASTRAAIAAIVPAPAPAGDVVVIDPAPATAQAAARHCGAALREARQSRDFPSVPGWSADRVLGAGKC